MEAQEWKLKTDLTAFEVELRLFVLRYPSQTTRLISFGINRGLLERLRMALDAMLTPQTDPPLVRSFSITMQRPRIHRYWRWLPTWVKVGLFVARRISTDHIVLTVRARSEDGQPFIEDFLQHCQDLWEATRLSWTPTTRRSIAGSAVTANGTAAASIQTSQGDMPPQTQPSTDRKQRTAQLSTADKLDRLRALRQSKLKANRVDIAFTTACNQIDIDPKTVREHAPELRRRWSDPTYTE